MFNSCRLSYTQMTCLFEGKPQTLNKFTIFSRFNSKVYVGHRLNAHELRIKSNFIGKTICRLSLQSFACLRLVAVLKIFIAPMCLTVRMLNLHLCSKSNILIEKQMWILSFRSCIRKDVFNIIAICLLRLIFLWSIEQNWLKKYT